MNKTSYNIDCLIEYQILNEVRDKISNIITYEIFDKVLMEVQDLVVGQVDERVGALLDNSIFMKIMKLNNVIK